MTGQPDFAQVTITYTPGESIVELKSLKLYLWSYRQEGAFHEDVTNRIADDLVAAVAPRRLTVTTDWLGPGGGPTFGRGHRPEKKPPGGGNPVGGRSIGARGPR